MENILSVIKDKKRFIELTLFWLIVLLSGLIVRLPLLSSVISTDYSDFVEPWFQLFMSEGYSVFRSDTILYNPSYPFLLSFSATLLLADFLPNYPIIAVKFVSIIFDFIGAFFVYKCVSLKYHESDVVPCLAALITFFQPTLIINSTGWGQNDIIYSAFLIACLYAMLVGRQAWAFVAFGLSFSFKAQAVFMAPFILWLLVKRRVNLRYIILSPLVYFILLLPAWLIGRPLDALLSIYIEQANTYRFLNSYAPNLYALFPFTNDPTNEQPLYDEIYFLGVCFTVCIVLTIALFLYKSRVRLTADLLVHLATFSVLIMPLLLPKMHERYFMPAEIMAIVFAFYFPKYWYIPVMIGLPSFMATSQFLYEYELIPLQWLSILMIASMTILGAKLLQILEHLPPLRRPIFRIDKSRKNETL